MDKCREEFEQYIRDQSGFTADFQIGCNGQYKSDLMHFMFATYQHQQAKVEEAQTNAELLNEALQRSVAREEELQKRVDELDRKLQIKTRHCEFFEQSRKGHRSLAIHRKKQINSALEQIEKLYAKAESDYEKECNPYYDGMLSALDLAEQAIRGELEEQALKGDG